MKRIVLLVVSLVCLWTSVAFAEEKWEYIGDHTYVDVNSIKTMQVGYSEVVKATTKILNSKGNLDTIIVLVIDKDTKNWCGLLMDIYDEHGKIEMHFVNDPRDSTRWVTDKTKTNDEILKRAGQ